MYNMEVINSLVRGDIKEIQDIRKKNFERFNSLPIPSWKRVKLNDLEIPEFREYSLDFMQSDNSDVEIRNIKDGFGYSDGFMNYFKVDEAFGVGEKFTSLGESLYNSGILAGAGRNIKSSGIIRINYNLSEANPLVIDHNIIVAEEGSRITLVFDYSSDGESEAGYFHNGVTKVFAKQGAEVNIIKIQRLGKYDHHFDSNIALVERDARVNWISVEIGGSLGAASYVNNLEGTASEADIKAVYLGDGDMRLDLGYTMNHIGMRSRSNIEVRGALKDRARKVFRGNLHFRKGAARSKGSEEEYVLLLDPSVKSDAIPVLFCSEDDVEGNHAASAGQIDEEKLFYLMSRGFEEREARKLIVEASFRPILDKIPLDELREAIEKDIHRRLVYA